MKDLLRTGPGTPRIVLQQRISATVRAVDHICLQLRGGVLLDVPAADRFAVELLVREALTNAVIHGAKADPADSILFEMERFPEGVSIRVSDNGAGFDWRRHLAAEAAPLAESGRGIQILRRYSDRLQFNASGNLLEVVRLFKRRTRYDEF